MQNSSFHGKKQHNIKVNSSLGALSIGVIQKLYITSQKYFFFCNIHSLLFIPDVYVFYMFIFIYFSILFYMFILYTCVYFRKKIYTLAKYASTVIDQTLIDKKTHAPIEELKQSEQLQIWAQQKEVGALYGTMTHTTSSDENIRAQADD